MASSRWPPSDLRPDVVSSVVSKHREDRGEHNRPASRTLDPGFLGSTSFSAIYQEEKSLNGPQHNSRHQSVTTAGTNHCLYAPNRDSQVKKGMTCLALVADFCTLEPIILEWQNTYSWVTMTQSFTSAIEHAVRVSVYESIASVHGAEREAILAQKSAEIYHNSMQEFEAPPNATIDEYAAMLGDPSCLRWDSLGMYFTAAGLGACYANQGAPRSMIEQRRRLAKTMLEASDTCLLLCEELGQLTDLELFLHCERSHLASVVEGDSSYIFWRRLGDFISAITTKGLHVGSNASPDVSFWLSEIRKRIFCNAYNSDKSISTFMGRPPRLPRKYCAMQLPLDLDFDHLRLSMPLLETELESLDAAGWNTAKEFRANLYARTTLICNMIREDILELALTSLPSDDITIAENILQRSRSAWESFPLWIRKVEYTGKWQGHRLIAHLSSQVFLNFKYNEFLLYRAVVKRFPANAANEEELLRLSAETLAAVMDDITHMNLLGKYDCDLPWTLAKFALPTAGVLALELLRQSQGLNQRRSSASFNRSAVVQNLSNLVAAMEWAVLPFDGNYEICSQAKNVLQRILDRVLSSPEQACSTAVRILNGTATGTSRTGSASSEYLWLNQASSEPEFWSSLPTHPLLAT